MPTIATPKASTDLGCLLSRASYAITAELAAALAEVGISERTYHVLSQAMSGEWTQGQLAEMCVLDKTTMVVTLDRLEKAGYAERRQLSSDRRARIVSVTEAGRQVVATANKIVADIYDDVLSTLPSRERETFLRALTELVEGRLSPPTSWPNAPRRRRTPG